jgi:hypothetical protein
VTRWLPALLCCVAACPTTTEPPPDAEACPEGTVLLGEECVDATCGVAPWGFRDPEGAVLVDASAPEGGDGSAAAPFARIAPAVLAAPGSRIVVASGTYAETLRLGPEAAGTSIEGRCAELVVIDASGGDSTAPGIDVVGPGIDDGAYTVAGLTVRAAHGGGVRFGEATGSLEAVTLVDSELAGLLVTASSVVVRDVRIEHTILSPVDGGGFGVRVDAGSLLEAERLYVTDSARQGFQVESSELHLTDSDVVDTQLSDEPLPGETARDPSDLPTEPHSGIGIALQESVLTASDLRVVNNRFVGISLFASTGTLTGVTVTDTRSEAGTGKGGFGIALIDGARLEGTGIELLRNRFSGLTVAESVAVVSDIRIAETEPEESTQKFGRGVEVVLHGELEATDLTIEDNHDLGMVIDGSRAVLRGAYVARTAPRKLNGLWGRGIEVINSGTLDAADVLIEDNRCDGIAATHSTITLSDIVIRGTREEIQERQHGPRHPVARWQHARRDARHRAGQHVRRGLRPRFGRDDHRLAHRGHSSRPADRWLRTRRRGDQWVRPHDALGHRPPQPRHWADGARLQCVARVGGDRRHRPSRGVEQRRSRHRSDRRQHADGRRHDRQRQPRGRHLHTGQHRGLGRRRSPGHRARSEHGLCRLGRAGAEWRRDDQRRHAFGQRRRGAGRRVGLRDAR